MRYFRRHFPFKSGFTLIELLIVITIIGVLAALGAGNFISSQRTARDTSRRNSVKAMQDAMEQYYAANGTYTGGCTSLATYLPAGKPLDPSTMTIDCTEISANAYSVWASLEKNSTGNCNISHNPQVNGPNFCLRELQ